MEPKQSDAALDRMNLEYICRYYNVPAAIGRRIRYEGRDGEITGTSSHYLRARVDGIDHEVVLHPTYHLDYVDA